MPQHKSTWYFGASVPLPGSAIQAADASQGWSETWYFNEDVSDQAALLRMLPGSGFFNARRNLLTPGWRIVAARVIRFPGSRTGARAGIVPADGQGRYSAAGAAGSAGPLQDEAAYDSLVMSVNGAAGTIRSWLIRGIGSDVITGSGQFNSASGFASYLTTLQTTWQAPLSIRKTTPGPVRPVITVQTAGAALVGLPPPSPQTPYVSFALPAPELVNGAVVRISGVVGMAGINGLWTVAISQTAMIGTVLLQQKRGRTVLGTYVSGGTISVRTPSLDPVASIFPEFGTSRKTGRPTTPRRGRRKARQ